MTKVRLLRRPTRLRRLRDRAEALKACRSGLALTEFAFGFPIVLMLGLYGLETANLALAHMRISNIAMLTADNAARVRDSIDEADVAELFTGAKSTGNGIRFAQNGRIIVSDFEPNAANTRQWMRWQRCDGALNVSSNYGAPLTSTNTPITNGTEFFQADRITASSATQQSSPTHATLTAVGPAGNQIQAQPGTAMMVVEVSYTYQPIVSNNLFGPITIRYESAFNVRQRTNQSVTNTGRITPRSCNLNNA